MTNDEGRSAPDLLAQASELTLAEELRTAVANVQTAADLAAYYGGANDTLADLEKARSAADDLVDGVERLTAEVERLNEVRLNTRDQWRADLDEIAVALGIRKDLPADRIVVWAKAAGDMVRKAWVERDQARGLLRGMARRASSLRRQADRWHSRAEQEFRDRVADTAKAMAESGQQRAEVSRLREQLAAVQDELVTQNRLYRKVGAERDEKQFEIERLRRWVDRFRAGLQESQEQVERTRRAERRSISAVLEGMVAEARAAFIAEFGDGESVAADKLREVQDFAVELFKTSGPVELDEFESGVEAPQPRHVVDVERRESLFYAECTVCHDGTHSPDQKVAEDWKDEHEADTLRPVSAWDLLGIAQEKTDEGRPSGSEQLAPLPVAQDEYIVRTADNGDLPQRIKKVGVHRPVWVDVDCPSCGDTGGCGHADLLCCEECDDNWPCNVVANVAEELERMAFRVEGEPVRVLIGRARELRGDAAQAARSEATPEEFSAHAKVMADQYRQFADLIESNVPSPSLRKEGEDSGND